MIEAGATGKTSIAPFPPADGIKGPGHAAMTLDEAVLARRGASRRTGGGGDRDRAARLQAGVCSTCPGAPAAAETEIARPGVTPTWQLGDGVHSTRPALAAIAAAKQRLIRIDSQFLMNKLCLDLLD